MLYAFALLAMTLMIASGLVLENVVRLELPAGALCRLRRGWGAGEPGDVLIGTAAEHRAVVIDRIVVVERTHECEIALGQPKQIQTPGRRMFQRKAPPPVFAPTVADTWHLRMTQTFPPGSAPEFIGKQGVRAWWRASPGSCCEREPAMRVGFDVHAGIRDAGPRAPPPPAAGCGAGADVSAAVSRNDWGTGTSEGR
jgi:hypothetical protein